MKDWKRTLTMAAGLVAGIVLVRKVVRSRYSFEGKVCVVTGGSRGLGLVLSRQLAAQGATVAMLARNGRELHRALSHLEPRGRHLGIATDVTNPTSVSNAIEKVVANEGRVDVLINNAGIIQVGPFEHLTPSDFDEAIDVHMKGPLYTMMAVIPLMREQGGGRIVNISSIGGKLAFPHLLPYTASKHGLVGLSDGFRHELRKDKIRVTTVCPGLIRTGSPPNALFKGQHRKEYAWFAISDSLPLVSKNAEKAGRQILRACARGDAELTITLKAKLAAVTRALFPGATASMLAAVSRLLPSSLDRMSAVRHTGWASQSALAPSLLTALGDRASVRNNE